MKLWGNQISEFSSEVQARMIVLPRKKERKKENVKFIPKKIRNMFLFL